jgi:hypothetical protein
MSARRLLVGILTALVVLTGACNSATPQPTVPVAPTGLPPMPTHPPVLITGTPTAVSLTVQINTKAWLRVTVDGEIVFEGQLDQGAEQMFTGRQSVSVRSSNAGAVQLSANGSPFEWLGPFGRVVEREWRLENGRIRVHDLQ